MCFPITLEKSSFQVKRSCPLCQGPKCPVKPLGPPHQHSGSAVPAPCSFPLCGNTVGKTALMVAFSAGVSPARERLIRFADQENAKSLVAELPIVVVNFAMATLPGWSHASLIEGAACSPQRPPSASECRGLSHAS